VDGKLADERIERLKDRKRWTVDTQSMSVLLFKTVVVHQVLIMHDMVNW
jgi:hypothetical protein